MKRIRQGQRRPC